jgi:GGDEF domain-containing protein
MTLSKSTIGTARRRRRSIEDCGENADSYCAKFRYPGKTRGDEFAALLFNLSGVDAMAKAAELECSISSAMVPWVDANLSVGASVGVAVIDRRDKPTTIIARADAAMYGRKAQKPHNSHRSTGGVYQTDLVWKPVRELAAIGCERIRNRARKEANFRCMPTRR